MLKEFKSEHLLNTLFLRALVRWTFALVCFSTSGSLRGE